MRKLMLPLLLCLASAAHADTPGGQVASLVPDARQVGAGRMTYLMWDVYDATLYAPAGRYDAEKPCALRLSYLRDLKGKDIAGRSVEEMRKQGYVDEVKLAAWYSQMEAIFPDVKAGTVLTGIRAGDGSTRFAQAEREIGVIRDPEFGTRFFAIWLSDKTTDPTLRRQLLGTR